MGNKMITLWCNQSHHCICSVEVFVWRYYMTFGTGVNTIAGIRATCYWHCLWCYVIPMPMASHKKKSCCISIWLFWPMKMQCWHWWHYWHHVMLLLAPVVSHDQQSCHTSFDHLDLRNAVVPLIRQASFNACTKDTTWPKSHVPSQFDYLNLGNVMVPLMTPFVSCDTKAGASGISWPKSLFAYHFEYLELMNVMVLIIKPSASYDADTGASGVLWPKMSFYTSFQSSWPKEYNCAI